MAMGRSGGRMGMYRSGGGPGTPETLVQFSPSDYAYQAANWLLVAGDFTLGCRFEATRSGLKCAGARVIAPTGSVPFTAKVRLAQAADSVIRATKSLLITSVGVHVVRFDSPIAIGGDSPLDLWVLSIYQTDTAAHVRFGDPGELPSQPAAAGGIIFRNLNIFAAGDVGAPGSESGTNRYPITPIIVR